MTKKATTARPEAAEPPRRIGRTTWLRLFGYYLVAGAVLALLTRLFPAPRLVGASGRVLADSTLAPGDWLARLGAAPLFPGGIPDWIDALMQMCAALLLALPIAFVYVRTRTQQKYDQSLVQTVVMLPIVVTAILVVVRDSLALAFSLTGIVAAIRFRNTLKESGDAVYVFGAIGIGFAAGIHALAVAVALSVVFVVIELAMWRVNAGAEFERTFARLCLPAGADMAYLTNDTEPRAWRRLRSLVGIRASGDTPDEGWTGRDATDAVPASVAVADAEAPAANGRGGLEDDRKPGEPVRVFAVSLDGARRAVEAVLDRDAKRWSFVAAHPEAGGGGMLEYEVRARKRVPLPELRRRLLSEGAPHVLAAD
jgi:small basic protein